MTSLGLEVVLVICTTEFSTFWKTSGIEEEVLEEEEEEGVGGEDSSGSDDEDDAACAPTTPPDDDSRSDDDDDGCCCRNKSINCVYIVLPPPLRIEKESSAVTKELTNNICS